jgi:acetyltransferase-like isoleucine patch superfamily enzyme
MIKQEMGLKLFLQRLRSKWQLRHRPKMVSPFFDSNGAVIKNTRVSNSTFIDNFHHLKLGENVFIGHFNFLEASNGVTIEEGCQITNYVSITSHSSHNSIRLYGRKYAGSSMVGYITGPIHIGKYTFIGPHSVIMPNTQIGKGCIIGAHSYVQGTFPDFAIIAGNPATVIGDTRTKDQVHIDEHIHLKESYDEWANA